MRFDNKKIKFWSANTTHKVSLDELLYDLHCIRPNLILKRFDLDSRCFQKERTSKHATEYLFTRVEELAIHDAELVVHSKQFELTDGTSHMKEITLWPFVKIIPDPGRNKLKLPKVVKIDGDLS